MNTSSINSTELLDAILRRDRIVVTFILVIVILACWVYLLSGAGTGMYPHKMVTLITESDEHGYHNARYGGRFRPQYKNR